MPPPTLDPVAREMYAAAGPLQYAEASLGYPLANYLAALGVPLEEIYALAIESDAGSGWSALLDPDRCPMWALPWLAQFVGVPLVPVTEVTHAAAIAAIKAHEGFARGTPQAVIKAVQETLTGSKAVYLTERTTSAYTCTVRTLTAETPDPTATCNAAKAAVPAGIVVSCVVSNAKTWAEVRAEGTWAAIKAANPTWQDVLT